MSLADEQRQLEEEIADLRKQQAITRQRISKIREQLDAHKKEHGDQTVKEKKKRDWEEKQPEFEARRQTPEWQEARHVLMDAMTDFPTGPKFQAWLNQSKGAYAKD